MIRKREAVVSRTRVRADAGSGPAPGCRRGLPFAYDIHFANGITRRRYFGRRSRRSSLSPAERKRLAAQCHQAAQEVFAAIHRSVGAELLQLGMPMGQFKAMAPSA